MQIYGLLKPFIFLVFLNQLCTISVISHSGFIYGYMLVAFKNPKRAQAATKVRSMINMEEECRFKSLRNTQTAKTPINQDGLYIYIYIYIKIQISYCLWNNQKKKSRSSRFISSFKNRKPGTYKCSDKRCKLC